MVLLCIKDVINEDTGEKYFLKDNYYTGQVEENSLFAIDEKNDKHYIAGSKGGLWHTDDWFSEHFAEDKRKTHTLLKKK
ncbi:hypothetical protein [Ammoniphilus resinae]|uniref:Uncharacterized protein n=1 Tax=Ammoniphilus resinae TaxID=861532 RepID=A0ABS4GNK5_9BACL|nr:hypothetical protein [Ammoniphilus resinae]MBP1931856.1 hypothetical protein [Ammoniphilus resinae]